MPVYEFKCNACGAAVSIFTRSISSPLAGVCNRCGSADLRRLVSRFAVRRSISNSDDFDNPDFLPDANDPKALARWARHMRNEMGEDGGPDMEEMIDRLERGESMNEDSLEDLASFNGTNLDDV